jgi:hypothetical protein
MMIRRIARQPLLPTVMLAIAVAACRTAKAPETPPVATPSVTLTHERVPAGSVMEVTYKFVVADGAKIDGDYRVFVHFLGADGDRMWGDDHEPPVPTSAWKPGQTVEYTRTVFAPVLPYVGETTMAVGLYGVGDRAQQRLTLAGEHLGQHAYKVARLDLAPQSENLFTVFKDGWHQAETADHDAFVEWQWTKQDATLAFRNPGKNAVLYLDLDSPGSPFDAQQVKVTLGGQVVDEFTITPKTRVLRKITLPSAGMGTADTADLHILVDKTFVPSQAGKGKDDRTLGVRVFHAFIDPR